METFPFYGWENQKGKEESQNRRPNPLPISSGPSEDPATLQPRKTLWAGALGVSVSLGWAHTGKTGPLKSDLCILQMGKLRPLGGGSEGGVSSDQAGVPKSLLDLQRCPLWGPQGSPKGIVSRECGEEGSKVDTSSGLPRPPFQPPALDLGPDQAPLQV